MSGIHLRLGKVAFDVLHADHERRLTALAGGQDGLRALQPFLLGKRGPAAGDLWPGETMHLIPVAEFDFRLQAIQVQLVRFGEGRLPDGKNAAHRLGLGGLTLSPEHQPQRAAAHYP